MKARCKCLFWLTAIQLPLLAACASVPEAPLRGVTSLTDHVSEAGQDFTLAFMPDADKVSVHVIWPNDWAHSSGMPVIGNLGVDLMSSGGAGSRSASEIKQVITGFWEVLHLLSPLLIISMARLPHQWILWKKLLPLLAMSLPSQSWMTRALT